MSQTIKHTKTNHILLMSLLIYQTITISHVTLIKYTHMNETKGKGGGVVKERGDRG